MFHIVDDDGQVCMSIGAAIQRAGYDCIHFYSADAYLKYMQTRCYEAPVALLIHDTILHVEGCDLVDVVRAAFPHQKILRIANGSGLECRSFEEDRFYACVGKQMKDEALLVLLNDLVVDQLLYPNGGARDNLSA